MALGCSENLHMQACKQGVSMLPGNPSFAWKGAGLSACDLAKKI